jgi:hypothetical protein
VTEAFDVRDVRLSYEIFRQLLFNQPVSLSGNRIINNPGIGGSESYQKCYGMQRRVMAERA